MDVEENKCNWTPFNNNQVEFRNELKELSELNELQQLASENINAYEDRVYEGSRFLGLKKRKERIKQFKPRKLKKQHAMKNRDC